MLYLSALMPVISIIGAAITNADASTLLKYSTSYKASAQSHTGVFYLLFVGAMALLGASFPFYAQALAKLKLSAGAYVAVALAALFVFRETYLATRILGSAVVIIGVLLVSYDSVRFRGRHRHRIK